MYFLGEFPTIYIMTIMLVKRSRIVIEGSVKISLKRLYNGSSIVDNNICLSCSMEPEDEYCSKLGDCCIRYDTKHYNFVVDDIKEV